MNELSQMTQEEIDALMSEEKAGKKKRQTSSVTLYKNVPLRNDYKHVLKWDSPEERDEWFDQFEFEEYTNSSYQRVSQRIRYGGNFEDLWNYNYVKVVNNNSDGTTRNTWYGFIEATIYGTDKVSLIDWSEDPWTTNQFNVDFMSANVERGHVKRWVDYAKRIPDLTHLGTEEPIGISSRTSVEKFQNIDWEARAEQSANIQWLVIVTLPQKGADEGSGKPDITLGSMFGAPSPFSIYVVPFKRSGWTYPWRTIGDGKPDRQQNFSNVGGAYVPKLMQKIALDPQFMSAGQNIVSMYTAPYLGIAQGLNSSGGMDLNWTYQYAASGGTLSADNPYFDLYSVKGGGEEDKLLKLKFIPRAQSQGYMVSNNVWEWAGKGLEKVIGKESKLLTHPYTALQLNDAKGNSHTFSAYDLPFSIDNKKNEMALRVMRYGSVGLQQKSAYYIDNLGYNQENSDRGQQGFESLDFRNMIIDTDTNSLPVITDNFTSFLVSSQNQITQARNQALNTKNAVEMQNSNAIRNMGISQGSQTSQLNASQNTARANNNNLTLAQSGVMKGAKSALGKATGGLTDQLGAMYTTQSEAFVNNLNTEMGNMQISQGAERDIMANNTDVSNRIASNNYEMAIAGIQAKQNDIKNTGWSLTSAGGNPFFDFLNNNRWITVSSITESYDMLRQARQYFEQFGYTIGRFYNGDEFKKLINGRKRFNYVKTQNLVVSGQVPNHERDAIQDMFNNGVTIWHDINIKTMYQNIEDNDEI